MCCNEAILLSDIWTNEKIRPSSDIATYLAIARHQRSGILATKTDLVADLKVCGPTLMTSVSRLIDAGYIEIAAIKGKSKFFRLVEHISKPEA